MSRIVYMLVGTKVPRGGHKVSLRHVEVLRDAGYSAFALTPPGDPVPDWIAHAAPVRDRADLADDDILVIPEDATAILRQFARSPHRKVVFCQNQFQAAAVGVASLPKEESGPYRDFMACSQTVAHWLARFVAHDAIGVVPAFADERLFRPAAKSLVLACSPRKRPYEFRAIRTMVSRLYQGRSQWRWGLAEDKSEREVADLFGEATVFLSLSRLEGLGMTPLEAMASGCLPVGFTGIGGREFATTANGFWVEEDDCEACAQALVEVMMLLERGSPIPHLVRDAAERTAAHYTYARFCEALRGFWAARLPPGEGI